VTHACTRTHPESRAKLCARGAAWRERTLVIVVAGAIGAVAACGATQHPLPKGQQSVAAIELQAAKDTKITAKRADIVDGLALERARVNGDPFDQYLLAVDTERVRGWYVRKGYFRAQVTADVVPQGNAMKVVFKIDEGKRSHLTRVEIGGLPDDKTIDVQAIRDTIKLKDGDWFDYDVFDLAKGELTNVLARWGYPKAHVDMSVAADQVRDEAIIRLTFRPGPLCTFGPITIEGTSEVLADHADARLSAKPGTRYSSIDLANSRAALYDMKRFSMVRIEPDLEGEGNLVPVKFIVTESTRHELRLGAGLGMSPVSYEVRARAGYTITGWPGPLETTKLEVKPSLVRMRDTGQWEPRVEALAAIERMDLFRPFMTGTAEVGVAYTTVEAYTSTGPHVQLGLKTPLYGRYLQAAAMWHLEELWFQHVSPGISPTLEQQLHVDAPQRLGFYEQTLIADLRDNQVEPRRGAYGEIRLHEGTIAAGGAFTYLKAIPELRGYYPLGPVVFGTRARVGLIWGDMPATERFFAGGSTSMRGFGERRLSPYVDTLVNGTLTHVPYGGGAMVELSEEARFPIGSLFGLKIGGVAFLDGGDDTETIGQLNIARLHWAAGPGLRVNTLIGAIRLDVAYRLNRYGDGEPSPGSRLAFHVSIGEAF